MIRNIGVKKTVFFFISLTIKIKNVSDEEILIYRVNKYSDYYVYVWDDKGEKVDLTNFGKKMQNKSKRNFLKLLKEILKPNAEITDTIRLNGLYDLTLSKKYYVKVEKSMNPSISSSPTQS